MFLTFDQTISKDGFHPNSNIMGQKHQDDSLSPKSIGGSENWMIVYLGRVKMNFNAVIFYSLIIIIKYSKTKMNLSLDIQYTNTKTTAELQSLNQQLSDDNSLCPESTSKTQPEIKMPRKHKAKKNYYWNDTENRRYIKFIMAKKPLFLLSLEERKRLRVNKLMGKAIQTRSPTQCYTHHQKMVLRYGSLDQIINAYEYLLVNDCRKIAVKVEEIQIQSEEIEVKLEQNQMQVQKKSSQCDFVMGQFNDDSSKETAQLWKEYLEVFMFSYDQNEDKQFDFAFNYQ